MAPKQPREFACEQPCNTSCPVVNLSQEARWAVGVLLKDNPSREFRPATPDQKREMAQAALRVSGVKPLDATPGIVSSVIRAGTVVDNGQCKKYG